MADYKVFPLDAGGHVEAVFDVDCTSDADAVIAAVQLLKPGQRAEVWQRERLVRTVQAPE